MRRKKENRSVVFCVRRGPAIIYVPTPTKRRAIKMETIATKIRYAKFTRPFFTFWRKVER